MRLPRCLLCLVVAGCGAPPRHADEPLRPIEVSSTDADAAARALVAHVDPQLGIVVVEDVADTESEDRPTRRATLRCGAQLEALATELATYLGQRPPPDESPGWSCSGTDCELPGMMEYDPNRILRFGTGSSGEAVVRGYFAIDALAVEAEHLAGARLNADRDFAELSQHRCD